MTKSRITGALSQLLLTAVISPILAVSSLSDGGDHERFKRRDPLNSFRYYDGGFNVRNKHYWAATAFTGIHGYAVAGVLIIVGICLGLYVAFSDKRRRVSSTRRRYLDRYYLPLFLLLLLFMFLSVVTTGIVIAANQRSKNRTEEMKETIDKAGEDVNQNIRTVIVSLTKIQYLLLPYDQNTTHLLNVTTHRLGKGSRLIQSFLHHKGRSIDLAIKISTSIASLAPWIHHGDILVLDHNNSLLGSNWIRFLYTHLNSKVAESMRSNALTDRSNTVSWAPESGIICDPFVGQQINSYTPQSCSNGAIPIGEFPNILSRFTCHDKDPPETCRITGKFIPEAAYLKVYAYSNSAQGMLDILPSFQNLTECLAVKDTLSSIVSNQCDPFRASMYRLWASILALSLIMVVLVLLFLAKAFQEKGKSFAWFSIHPTSSAEIRQVNI
ncbi:unnamed protein product [Arabidopsis thaliana]|uniref:Gb/AAF26013.1 n=1 Tax=Arabidopsis thaliana TaxID=3702 RepID=Q9FJW8_ARATH|nr:unnamed protein product [Arabidopsis thaliana]